MLLFVLAVVVVGTALASLALRLRPETSRAGICITIAALLAMPVLAWLKRREAHHSGNTALAADAAQSATCAYLALIALVGLGTNAFFPYRVVRYRRCAGGSSYPRQRGYVCMAGQSCGCC